LCQISWTVALAGRFSQSDLLLSTVIPIVLVITSEVTTTGWGLWSEVDTPLEEKTVQLILSMWPETLLTTLMTVQLARLP
jgi:hypothetical protein